MKDINLFKHSLLWTWEVDLITSLAQHHVSCQASFIVKAKCSLDKQFLTKVNLSNLMLITWVVPSWFQYHVFLGFLLQSLESDISLTTTFPVSFAVLLAIAFTPMLLKLWADKPMLPTVASEVPVKRPAFSPYLKECQFKSNIKRVISCSFH